ncbi:MAG: hypothetical protein R3Y62_07700, partial [Eubacteriales bacterium]
MERDLECALDRVFLEQEALVRLAESVPTPFYLYDGAGTSRTVEGTAAWVGLNHCPSDGVAQLLFHAGCGLICSDVADLKRVEALGFRGRRILFAPMVPRRDALELAVALEVTLGIDNPGVVDCLLEWQMFPSHLQLRYNPCGKLSIDGRVRAKLSRSKLGMRKEDLLQTAKKLKNTPISTWSLGAELGTFLSDVQYYASILQLLWELKPEVEQAGHCLVTGCYLGDAMTDCGMDALQEIRDILLRKAEKLEIPSDFSVEYGLSRPALESHCILVSKVLAMKELERPVVILDAVRGDLPPVSKGTDVYVSLAGDISTLGRVFYTIVGQ